MPMRRDLLHGSISVCRRVGAQFMNMRTCAAAWARRQDVEMRREGAMSSSVGVARPRGSRRRPSPLTAKRIAWASRWSTRISRSAALEHHRRRRRTGGPRRRPPRTARAGEEHARARPGRCRRARPSTSAEPLRPSSESPMMPAGRLGQLAPHPDGHGPHLFVELAQRGRPRRPARTRSRSPAAAPRWPASSATPSPRGGRAGSTVRTNSCRRAAGRGRPRAGPPISSAVGEREGADREDRVAELQQPQQCSDRSLRTGPAALS